MASTAAGGYYPPVGFHFKVEFAGIGNDNDIRFQSVSGLNVEYDVENFKEGGENRFEHQLPVRTKYTPVSLKRGMLTDSKVIEWCMNAFQKREFNPADVYISLLNDKHTAIKTWHLHKAWPRKWSVSDMNASENAIVVETMDLSYTHFTVK